ncbi:MAG: phage baseplate plug family protein [Candidatus Adiutrix sp.]
MFRINLARLPAQKCSVVLGPHHATISLRQRGDYMYLDLWVNEEPVCLGAICQNDVDIVQSPNRLFKGILKFIDLEGQRPPSWETLESRHILLYLPPD